MIRLFWKAWLLPIPQSETIIANGTVSVIKLTDAQKILNLKHAWEFILNKDVLSYCQILTFFVILQRVKTRVFIRMAGEFSVCQ